MNQDYREIFAQEQLDIYTKLAERAEMEEQQRERRLEEEQRDRRLNQQNQGNQNGQNNQIVQDD